LHQQGGRKLTAALGFGGIYERFQATQAGFANDPIACRRQPKLSAYSNNQGRS
jgi:hypothetical protein